MVPTLKLNGILIIETETDNQRQRISWKVDECIVYDRNALKSDNKLRISGEYKDENSKTHSIVATILITKEETSRVVYNGGGYDDITGVFVVNGKPGNIEINFPEYGNHDYSNKRKKSSFLIASIRELVRPLSGNKNKYHTKYKVGEKVSIARNKAEFEVEISDIVRGLKDHSIKYLAPCGGDEDFWVIEEDEIINQKENVGNNKAHLKRDHAVLNAPTLEIVPKDVFEEEEKEEVSATTEHGTTAVSPPVVDEVSKEGGDKKSVDGSAKTGEDITMTDGTTVSSPEEKDTDGHNRRDEEPEMNHAVGARVKNEGTDKYGIIEKIVNGKYHIKEDDGTTLIEPMDEDDFGSEYIVVPHSAGTHDNDDADNENDSGNSGDDMSEDDDTLDNDKSAVEADLNELQDNSEGRKDGHSAEAVSAKGVLSVTEDSNAPKAAEGGDANEKENAAPKGDTENTGGAVTSKKLPFIPTVKFPSIPTIGGGGKKKKSKSGSPKSEDNNEAGIFRNTRQTKAKVNNIIKEIVQEKKKVVASINRLDEVKKKMDTPGVDVEVKTLFLKYYLQMVNNNDLTMPEHLRKNVYEPWEEACKKALEELQLVKHDGEELDWNKLSVDEVRKLAKLLTL